jgi:hypothetical protein
MQEFGQLYDIVLPFAKGKIEAYNLKQTSISEQTIWQKFGFASEEIGAGIKLSLLYPKNIAVLRPQLMLALKTCNSSLVDIQTGCVL